MKPNAQPAKTIMPKTTFTILPIVNNADTVVRIDFVAQNTITKANGNAIIKPNVEAVV